MSLSQRVHESASLAVLAGDRVQHTARFATNRVMNVNITIGTRFPAYATSMGTRVSRFRRDRAAVVER